MFIIKEKRRKKPKDADALAVLPELHVMPNVSFTIQMKKPICKYFFVIFFSNFVKGPNKGSRVKKSEFSVHYFWGQAL